MPDEEEPIDETRDLTDDVPFQEAMENAQAENYLGDRSTVEAIVRKTIDDLTDKAQKAPSKPELIRVMKMLADRAGAILLGKSPLFKPLPGWNEPGRIDVFLAKWLGSSETDPDVAMEHCFVILFGEIFELAEYASTDGVLPEQWQFQLDALIDRFVNLCLGIDPPTMAMMENQTAE